MIITMRRATLTSIILFVYLVYQEKYTVVNGTKFENQNRESPPEESRARRGEHTEQCDISAGEWVHDDAYPLYSSTHDCPYIRDRYDCRKNGRPDSHYERWRWNARDCNIPRFNALQLLENLKGKRLMFVGDSMSNSQWQSMICMLQAVILDDKKSLVTQGKVFAFKAQEYNASVEFFWAAYLVDLVTSSVGNESERILRVDSVESNAKRWTGADIIVFDSALWWPRAGKSQPWDYIQEGNRMYKDMDRMVAYRKALTTWANWVDTNLDPSRTRIFFRTISPAHYNATQWDNARGHNCYGETEPIIDEAYLGAFPPQMEVLKGVLHEMKFNVSVLNITRLSEFRKDAHVSVYGDLTPAQRRDPDDFSDCTHWCIWGLPDIWNELLAALLLFD